MFYELFECMIVLIFGWYFEYIGFIVFGIDDCVDVEVLK